MNIAKILHTQATTCPETIAVIDTDRRRRRATSFAELESASICAAGQLHQAGLRPGDTVLVFQPMSAELYIMLAAIFRLGLTAMFLDPGQGRAYIEQCCALSPPQALIAGPKAHLLRLISPALRRIPRKFIIAGGGRLRDWSGRRLLSDRHRYASEVEDIFPCLPDTPALLTFTSGSTGQPKAALRSHGFLLSQHQVLADSLNLTAGQIDLTTMPIVALANLASGVTSLIPKADLRYPGNIDPAPIVNQILSERVESAVASPALLERLAHYCFCHQILLPGLQKIFTGGGPVFPHLLDRLQQIAPNANVVAVYGSTEAEPISKIERGQLSDKDIEAMLNGRGLLAGPPVEAINLKILRYRWGASVGPYSQKEFTAACCAPDEIGEIVVNGNHVLSGYLHGRGDEETKFRVDGALWHRTGDAGYRDGQGRLWLMGRCAARIKDERGTLYPFAVECAASHQPDIRRSAVVSHKGKRILVVEFFNNANDALQINFKKNWADIDEIKVCRHIPVDKRHNAKIDYPALYKLFR